MEPAVLDTDAAPLSVHELQMLAARLRIDRVIITPRRADDAGVINLIDAATSTGLKVSVLPRVLEVAGSSVEFDDVEGIPLLSMRALGLTRSSRIVKRTVDVIGAGLAVVALSPVMIIAAIAIALDSSGPVFFGQRRIGRDGTPFKVFKFRTMVVGADEQKHKFLHLNQADGLFKIAEDPRVTRVGRFLRRTSLDELPQLLNVLRGEMSLVGPSTADRGGGQAHRGLAAAAATADARHDGTLADPGLRPDPAGGDDQDRLPVCDQLVALA